MKIFVINLEHRQDRRDNVEKLLNGLDYSLVQAVNGENLDSHTVKRCRSYLQKSILKEGQLREGEIGCSLSHLKTYKQIIDNELPGALIFEDDIYFTKEISIENIKKDVCFLPKNKPFILTLGSNIHPKTSRAINIADRVIIGPTNNSAQAHAYYINNIAAKNLLAVFGEYPFMAIDMYRQLKYAVNIYGYKSPMCLQNSAEFTSDIQKDNSTRYDDLGRKFKLLKVYYQIRATIVKKIFLPIYIKYKISS